MKYIVKIRKKINMTERYLEGIFQVNADSEKEAGSKVLNNIKKESDKFKWSEIEVEVDVTKPRAAVYDCVCVDNTQQLKKSLDNSDVAVEDKKNDEERGETE